MPAILTPPVEPEPTPEPDAVFYGFPWKCVGRTYTAYGATAEAAMHNWHRHAECERLNKKAEREAYEYAVKCKEAYDRDRLTEFINRKNQERLLAEEQERRRVAREKYAQRRHLIAIKRRLKRVDSGFFRHRRLVHAALGNCGVI